MRRILKSFSITASTAPKDRRSEPGSISGWPWPPLRVLKRAAQGLWSLLGPADGWSGLRRWFLQIATLGILVVIGGLLFSASGLAPIGASSGHWPITAWFLNFSMSRSVSTHSLGIDVPDLDSPSMMLRGATHYETGCFPCHGNPAIPHPRIASKMTPHPPYLPSVIQEWEPEELFYIVKHGVKFTGMPAWPAQERDDEVWSVVAFLQKFPQLSEHEYQELVNGRKVGTEQAPLRALVADAEPRAVSTSCRRCHGADGQGRGSGAFPKLAGQKSAYLAAALQAYKRSERPSGIMEPHAAGLTRQEIQEIARFYESLPDRASSSETASNAQSVDSPISRGAIIALEGVPDQRIPICVECHGPGNHPRKPDYPNLAGQSADYITLQLELFARNVRGGSPYAEIMQSIAGRLSREQMRDVALYFQSLEGPRAVPVNP